MSNLQNFLDSAEYLPEVMRDFHDAKELFNLIHHKIDTSNNMCVKDISWVSGQVYTIDIFLWFMAKRGYTLQKCRRNLEFNDLDKELVAFDKMTTESFAKLLQQGANK